MNIEQLTTRIDELDKAIINSTQSVYMLQGHKAEAAFHLEELKKAAAALEIPLETPVE